MQTIQSLRVNLNQQEALEELLGGGLRRLLRNAHGGPLRSLAQVFVPFRLHHVSVCSGASRQSLLLGVDTVRGTLDPYGFERLPNEEEFFAVETRNVLPTALEEARTREIALSHARRQLYRTGFLRLRNFRLQADTIPVELYIPYWIGFFGRGVRARIAVMDAVRRRLEGTKAREFFESWILD